MSDLTTLTWIEQRYLLALANFLLCGALAWGYLCRITAMSSDTATRLVRGAYSLAFAAAIAVGTQPWWLGDLPGWAELIQASAALALLVAGRRAWVNGPPSDVQPRPKWPPIGGTEP